MVCKMWYALKTILSVMQSGVLQKWRLFSASWLLQADVGMPSAWVHYILCLPSFPTSVKKEQDTAQIQNYGSLRGEGECPYSNGLQKLRRRGKLIFLNNMVMVYEKGKGWKILFSALYICIYGMKSFDKWIYRLIYQKWVSYFFSMPPLHKVRILLFQ